MLGHHFSPPGGRLDSPLGTSSFDVTVHRSGAIERQSGLMPRDLSRFNFGMEGARVRGNVVFNFSLELGFRSGVALSSSWGRETGAKLGC